MDYPGYSWTAGSRKHGVSRAQVRRVVEGARLYFVRSADPPSRPDEALLFVGDDADGTKLEVIGIELADGRLRVIHAMPMRAGYETFYKEAQEWRQ